MGSPEEKSQTNENVRNEDVTSKETSSDAVQFDGKANVELVQAATKVGERLSREREALKKSIGDVSDRLKLTPDKVSALEEGDVEPFSGRRSIYIEGYYRAYAQLLGVDINDTIFAVGRSRTKEITNFLTPQINYQSMPSPTVSKLLRDHMDEVTYGLVAAMVLVVAGVIWWVWPSSDELSGPATTGVVLTSDEAGELSSDDTNTLPYYLRDDQDTDDPARVSVPENQGESSNDLLTNETSSSQQPNVNEASTRDSNAIPDVQPSDDIMDSLEPEASTQSTYQDQIGTVVLSFSGLSWVEAYGANDDRLYYKTGQPGEIASLVGLRPISIRIGDAASVAVQWNDSDVDLKPHTSGRVAKLTLR